MKILMISIAGIVTFSISSYTVNADLVKLTKHSDKGFDEAYGWDSGKAPESGNDYLVCDGYYLRGDYNEGLREIRFSLVLSMDLKAFSSRSMQVPIHSRN